MTLSPQQALAIELALDGANVFITGPGGAGKSFLIRELVAQLERRGKVVYLTASTGIAAVNIGGTTLHAFAGVGLATEPVELLFNGMRFHKKTLKRWQCDVLIVDEISMVDPNFFTKLNELAKRVRRSGRAFGGIQLICCGDFFQLPPVQAESAPFAFETPAWREAQLQIVQLTQIFRQEDAAFVATLNKVRWGQLDDEARQTLLGRVGAQLDCSDGIEPTRLYSTNVQVDRLNAQRLAALPGTAETYTYRQTVTGLQAREKAKICAKIAQDCRAEAEVQLKVGAQVMLLANLSVENGLSNGSRGVVLGFEEEKGERLPRVRFANGLELPVPYYTWRIKSPDGWTVSHSQVPLRLAYGITHHKAQGLTLDRVELDLSNVFAPGQAYVALSRVRTLQGCSISGLDLTRIRAHPRVVQFYQ